MPKGKVNVEPGGSMVVNANGRAIVGIAASARANRVILGMRFICTAPFGFSGNGLSLPFRWLSLQTAQPTEQIDSAGISFLPVVITSALDRSCSPQQARP